MAGSKSPKRVVAGAPRWVHITVMVVLILGISGIAVAAGLSRLSDAASVRPTIPPDYSASAVDPERNATSTQVPTPVASADPVADPVAAPPVEQPTPVAPAKAALICPVGHLSGEVTGASVGAGPISYMPRITVTAYVRNDSNTRVILFRHDTPDVLGYTATGGVAIIELYGDWANTARASFAIQPGETLSYVTAWDVTQQQLDSVVALYASPDIGSLVAAWPTTEQLALCPSPLPNGGGGKDFPYSAPVTD